MGRKSKTTPVRRADGVIEDCKARLRNFKEALEYDASKEHAADYINRAHSSATIPVPLRASDREIR